MLKGRQASRRQAKSDGDITQSHPCIRLYCIGSSVQTISTNSPVLSQVAESLPLLLGYIEGRLAMGS